MYCQKCRSPLKLDGSLTDLNPAAFDLLVGSAGTSLQHSQAKRLPSSRPTYPQERKDLYDQVSQHAQSPVVKRTVPAPRHSTPLSGSAASPSKHGSKDNPAMSFVMLTESQLVPPPVLDTSSSDSAKQNTQAPKSQDVTPVREEQALSHRMEMAAKLFEIMSSRSDIDHPICTECTELLIDGLQKRLQATMKERDAYTTFLRQVNAEVPTEEELQKAEASLASAREAEEAAFAELQKLEAEKIEVDEEIAALEEESRQLDAEEEKFWRERNAFALTLSEFQNERDGINLAYDHDAMQLQRLQRTNVYNDTFSIGHDGFFGTINGLRLGRLATPPVEWAEINAAWGQTLLLLATVAEKMSFTFKGYRLKPMGSSSRIERIEYPQTAPQPQVPTRQTPKVTSLELFSSGDLPLGRMFLHRRFDNAMIAFLECLRQLGQFVEEKGKNSPNEGLALPYRIYKDKIGDPRDSRERDRGDAGRSANGAAAGTIPGQNWASIKLGYNTDEGWTRACKYVLTCCKYLLAFASNNANSNT